MRTSESVLVPAEPDLVFPYVARLDAYPDWLGLVHTAELVAAEPNPAWSVELRAQVGPFARSKQLRMRRTELRPSQLAVFERNEVDGREHSRWTLRAVLEPVDGATRVTMDLAYDGSLWTGGLLERVLDEQIRRGRTGLIDLVSGASTH